MTSMYDVLKASKGVPVNDIFAALWGHKLSGDYTIVTYTGTLPAVLTGTKAGYLHKYKIYGNTEQIGTPTPENPIVPQECGERTENLFDEEYGTITASIKYLPIYVGSGDFTLSTTAPLINGTSPLLFFLAGSVSSGAGPTSNVYAGKSRTQTAIDGYVTIAYREVSSYKPNVYQTMLVSGSTALPYEPYGYKLPLTSAGQDVDIYLGESQTTRRIKKLVLTGDEAIQKNSPTDSSDYLYYIQNVSGASIAVLCTHLPYVEFPPTGLNIGARLSNSLRSMYINFGSEIMDAQTSGNSIAGVKEYLADQYATGTPVTVWYVLNEPETGTLNEPLRKIGNYVDTIDSTQTSAQIPTSASSTTISWAGEGLAPSKVEFEYEK